MSAGVLRVWRHPRPIGAEGRCIGAGTDLPVHWRKAKRLARRVQAHARRERLPHEIACSPLQRSLAVGRWLRRWGWRVHVEAALKELDFGRWDGLRWQDIGRADVDAWVQDFAGHAPGGTESLQDLLQRLRDWQAPCALAISHGGWMLARRWLETQGTRLPTAAEWPAPPRYGELWRFSAPIGSPPVPAPTAGAAPV